MQLYVTDMESIGRHEAPASKSHSKCETDFVHNFQSCTPKCASHELPQRVGLGVVLTEAFVCTIWLMCLCVLGPFCLLPGLTHAYHALLHVGREIRKTFRLLVHEKPLYSLSVCSSTAHSKYTDESGAHSSSCLLPGRAAYSRSLLNNSKPYTTSSI